MKNLLERSEETRNLEKGKRIFVVDFDYEEKLWGFERFELYSRSDKLGFGTVTLINTGTGKLMEGSAFDFYGTVEEARAECVKMNSEMVNKFLSECAKRVRKLEEIDVIIARNSELHGK